MRGTFANIRIKNQMVPRRRRRRHHPLSRRASRCRSTTRRCATRRKACRWSIFAGKEYGTGSSRDWAAKGTKLLGVRAVIAAELRAHPPLQPGRHGRAAAACSRRARRWQTLGLKGDETVTIQGLGSRSQAAPETRGADRLSRTARRSDVPLHLPHRHARRARILPQRRHPALRAAAARGLKSALRPEAKRSRPWPALFVWREGGERRRDA